MVVMLLLSKSLSCVMRQEGETRARWQGQGQKKRWGECRRVWQQLLSHHCYCTQGLVSVARQAWDEGNDDNNMMITLLQSLLHCHHCAQGQVGTEGARYSSFGGVGDGSAWVLLCRLCDQISSSAHSSVVQGHVEFLLVLWHNDAQMRGRWDLSQATSPEKSSWRVTLWQEACEA